ncbi:hypothetical protein [Sedimentimonas flavescens]|uniref:hypothetical protein n=1 Tax=Sedimentimonas flavescens TaxID=2851012 RepID=UPI001C4A42FF|nr:hypothetical protein [Sedimentimonas flavescens]MBW0158752.1 hypothetical protein [Sedimentimonas flavescens]MCT2540240.1 hypothetical protein [Sedimentimonas flavescens]
MKMSLPHFLALILVAILAAGLTVWLAHSVGLSLAIVGSAALIGAAIARLMARVE